MKYTIKRKRKEFQPITMTITLESLAELKSMWARLNKANRWDDDCKKAKGAYLECYSLWNELDKMLEEFSND